MPPGRRKRQAAGSEPTGVLIKLKKNKADIAHSNDTMPNFPVKPTIRLSYSLAPGLQTHVLFIFVGLQRDLFTVHTALLPEKTRAILDERAQQQRIYLVEGNDAIHETFEIYRLFLYTGKLFSHHADSDQDHADNGDTEIHEDREWMRLAHAYLLGLDLRDERFCNAVVEGIIEKVTESDRYPTGLATEVYDQTDRNDKLRLLIVDLHIWKGRGTGLCEPHDDSKGPREFVQHVLEGFAAAGSAVFSDETQMPWDVNICEYHSHEITARCKKARSAGALKKRTAEGWR